LGSLREGSGANFNLQANQTTKRKREAQPEKIQLTTMKKGKAQSKPSQTSNQGIPPGKKRGRRIVRQGKNVRLKRSTLRDSA